MNIKWQVLMFFQTLQNTLRCQPGRPNPQGDSHPGKGSGDGFHKIKSAGSFLKGATSTLLPAICSSRFLLDRLRILNNLEHEIIHDLLFRMHYCFQLVF